MMRRWPDEKLIKQAGRTGRTLIALAAASAFCAVLLFCVVVRTRGAVPFLSWMMCAFALVAAGCWALAVAARRGSRLSVALAVLLIACQLGVTLALSAHAHAATAHRIPFFPGPVFLGVVVGLLFRNWAVLRELRRRGLSSAVFGPPEARRYGRLLCVVGAVALALGLAGVSGGSFIAVYAASSKGPRAIVSQARGFTRLVATEEKSLLLALESLRDTHARDGLQTAKSHFDRLERGLLTIRAQAAGNEPFLAILDAYGAAVDEWKKSLALLEQPNPDVASARQLQEQADRLRSEAVIAFNRQFESFNTNPY